MMEEKEKRLELINTFALILSIIIPTISLLITSPEEIKTQTYIIFGIIVLVLVIGGFTTYIISRWKKMNKDIHYNKIEMEDIKKDLNFKELWNSIDVRLKVLENMMLYKKNKRGQAIDPRIIMWILLAILIYLFLKSMGFFR